MTDALKFHWENREKMPIQRDGLSVSDLPLFLPSSGSPGWTGKMDFPEAAQRRRYSALRLPRARNAKVLQANNTVCSAHEQHIQANIHDLAYFSFVSRTYPVSNRFLKFSQDWFCPLLSTYAWKIPSKAHHKTHGYFPRLLQES